MNKERIIELAGLGIGLFIAKEVLKFSFTRLQRDAIKNRDEHHCQFPSKHNCNQGPDGKFLVVHHLLPQRYSQKFDIDPDFPENGLSICSNAHDLIHPDMVAARENFSEDKEVFDEVFEARRRMLDENKIYWVTTWDRAMYAIALRNTQKARLNGFEWPEKNHRRNGGK